MFVIVTSLVAKCFLRQRLLCYSNSSLFPRCCSSIGRQVTYGESLRESKGKKRLTIIITIICVGIFAIGLGICFILLALRKKKVNSQHDPEQENIDEGRKADLEVPLFDFETICKATSNFSLRNKLGQGGFGVVYKGILENGQEIAVKRLSKRSCQGVVEFKNEVLCISKLQHRNLVKLLGCCIEPHERIVTYEFMPNKSLDSFIFAVNVLLDYEMNPKISDFGLARSFDGDETEANTNRVVGTYGYMSHEYAIDGLFSIKSDVFSFGVLVLEIVTGRRNRGFSDPDHKLNLAWRLFNEGSSLELLDEKTKTCEISEVLRSIHVGLLCVQRRPKDRSCMAAAVLMLSSETSSLLRPKKPAVGPEGPVELRTRRGFYRVSENQAAGLATRDGGSGCILWFGDLIDIREFEQNGQTIYVRMAASEIESLRESKGKKRLTIIITVICVGIFAIGLSICFILLALRKKKVNSQHDPEQENIDEGRKADLEVPLFDFETICKATSNFSPRNKLGQGGFGVVYKGILENGQEIAVKRLSKRSCQGVVEFKNEVLCISKLQHRNLVKLLGCCIEPHERIVIYEKQSILLDWPKRFQIINGIARGLLYLHQDSRLIIIHRDLKAGNVLFDYEMNLKISDFGLARSFDGDETEANTNRVVGTYFGVLMLEIVTGRRNRGFSDPYHKLNLVGHAWRLFNEGRSFELLDEKTKTSCEISEVLRSIHVGLLCVQHRPKDRSCMAAAVLMLSSETSSLLRPKKPGYFAGGDEDDPFSTKFPFPSNSLTITLPR
ncbi:G-type lectin S-receptor-like serine/threonine-protein kinase [Hibiscus syriacus]|uniref:non-specific serine/threonine protein kinase n=1 Tax=Hibiscus syriacus TaxID=106335 RepID=A0A6A2ZC23_HIBSY|nr:G-type lectin S-receptor-like serine/threonine-protein kinase [Hibiscus syriacus]